MLLFQDFLDTVHLGEMSIQSVMAFFHHVVNIFFSVSALGRLCLYSGPAAKRQKVAGESLEGHAAQVLRKFLCILLRCNIVQRPFGRRKLQRVSPLASTSALVLLPGEGSRGIRDRHFLLKFGSRGRRRRRVGVCWTRLRGYAAGVGSSISTGVRLFSTRSPNFL